MPSFALIAEPDPGQARRYRHLALAEGFEVRIARDGDEALLLLRTLGAPTLTIAELALPRIDGFQLIAEIRRLAGPQSAHGVAVSAFQVLRDAARRMRAELGISALLSRNAPPGSMRRAVHKTLAASSAPRGPAPA